MNIESIQPGIDSTDKDGVAQSDDNTGVLVQKVLRSLKTEGIDALEDEQKRLEDIYEANQRKIEELQKELADLLADYDFENDRWKDDTPTTNNG